MSSISRVAEWKAWKYTVRVKCSEDESEKKMQSAVITNKYSSKPSRLLDAHMRSVRKVKRRNRNITQQIQSCRVGFSIPGLFEIFIIIGHANVLIRQSRKAFYGLQSTL